MIKEKNQISAIKEHGKQILESNEVAKNDFNIDRSDVSNEKQKEIFNKLAEEKGHEFPDIKDKIDLNKLIYRFKTSANEPKDFRNYQMPWKLFEDLKDGYINPNRVIKTGKNSLHQKDIIKNITNFFDLRERSIDFFRDYSFLLSEAKYNAKYGKELKILTSIQILQRLPIAPAQEKAGNK